MADASLAVRKSGSGPALVILHGLLGNAKNWQYIARQLSDDFCVFCVDLPNHGESYSDSNFNYPKISAQLHRTLVDLSLDKIGFFLMGHSMGGKIAMQYAHDYPQYLKGLIIVDIAPVNYPLHHQSLFAALNSVGLKNLKNRSEVDKILADSISNPAIRNFLLSSLVRKNDRWSWLFNLENLSRNQANVARKPDLSHSINLPTLLIKGELSDYIKKEHEATIRQFFPQLVFKQIANAGHWPHSEKSKTFLHFVTSFLKPLSQV